MKGIVLVNKGAEDVAALEIAELIGKKAEAEESVVKFPISDYTELCTVCYRAQSISRGFLLLAEFKVEPSLENTTKRFKLPDLKEWCYGSIRMDCIREGSHDFNSVDLAAELSKKIFSEYKAKTDFDTPDVIFLAYIYGDKGYFGVDFSGIDLSKRQYKIFHHPQSLKGTTAYYVVRRSGFDKKKVFVDPFMGSGMIVIEAALFASGFPVQYYDKDKLAFANYRFFKKHHKKFFEKHDKKEEHGKIFGYDFQLRYLKAVQKNAKIAGISDHLKLSKIAVDWLDTKFEKNTIDLIASDPPRISKKSDAKKIEKIYDELFYQAEYVLKKKGSLALLSKNIEELEKSAKKHKFIIKERYSIYQGKEEFFVLIFQRVG